MSKESWTEASRIRGVPTRSLTVLLKARGCSHAKRKAPCRFCAFHGFEESNPRNLGPDNIRAKLESAIAPYGLEREGVGELKIYNGGSFFANAEIRPKEREAILSLIAGSKFWKLLVESRPEHITAPKIKEATESLGSLELEVAIGLETMDDALRSRLKKEFALSDFEKAAAVLAEFGATLGAYVLIKPVRMSEEEAKADALCTLSYLAHLRDRLDIPVSARLEPFALYEGMEAEPGHTPVSLPTVMQIIRDAPANLDLFLGWSESEAGAAVTGLESIRDFVDRFNSTGDRTTFNSACSDYNSDQHVKS